LHECRTCRNNFLNTHQSIERRRFFSKFISNARGTVMRFEGKRARPLFVAAIAAAGTISAAGAQTPLWQGLNVSLEGAPQLLTSFPKNVFAQEITVPIPGITPLTTIDRRLAPDFGGTVKFNFENRFGPWDMGVAYRGSFSGRIEDRTGLAVTAAPITATFPVYPGVIIGPGGFPIPIGAGKVFGGSTKTSLYSHDLRWFLIPLQKYLPGFAVRQNYHQKAKVRRILW
jgi:hypothetical protein